MFRSVINYGAVFGVDDVVHCAGRNIAFTMRYINGICDTSTENKVVELKEEDNAFFFFCLFVYSSTQMFKEASLRGY